MAYVEEVCVAGDTVEVLRYHSPYNRPRGAPRNERSKKTTEQQFKCNERQAEKKLRRLLNANFVPGDYHLVLNYSKNNRPSSKEEMRKNITTFTRKLRGEFRKAGMELKYIHVMEIGTKGAKHHHLVIPKCDTDILRRCWPHARVNVYPLDDTGQYSQLASYLIKYSSAMLRSENRLTGKRWDPSRNLTKPVVKKRKIIANRFRAEPRERKGYYIDKTCTFHYVNDDGYASMQVMYVKNKRRE